MYEIDVSSNFVVWTPWTNCFNTNGTIDVSDAESPRNASIARCFGLKKDLEEGAIP